MADRADMSLDSIGWQASGAGGAIAAGHPASVAAGMQLLQAGGNAADAAVATLLALSVTDHGLYAIGGEVPLIIHDAQRGHTKVLSGLGRAPLDEAAIAWYLANGIATDGNIKAAPVPGAVDLCLTALRMYGTKPFADVVAPTLDLLAADGPDWYPRLSVTLNKLIQAERACAGPREEQLRAAADRFYRGDIADDLEAWYIAGGSFLRKRDLAAHVTSVEDPVTGDYRGYTICKCGPWTQGPSLCQMLRLLEHLDIRSMGHLSADTIHAATEAIKLAFADRDAYYGDPACVDVPMAALLSDEYTALRQELIDASAASKDIRPGDPYGMHALAGEGEYRPGPGGTTTCVVADRWGNVVAATPSCNVFGDKGDGGATGVTHGNRLRSLNTCTGHPNCIQPGKRPRITLTPTMVLKDNKPVMAISVAGGDLQDQTALNLLISAIDFDLAPAEAVCAPRFATNHHEDSFRPDPVRADARVGLGTLQISADIPQDVQTELTRRGHDVSTTDGAIAVPVMLRIDGETRCIHAAGDPKAGRHAAALPG